MSRDFSLSSYYNFDLVVVPSEGVDKETFSRLVEPFNDFYEDGDGYPYLPLFEHGLVECTANQLKNVCCILSMRLMCFRSSCPDNTSKLQHRTNVSVEADNQGDGRNFFLPGAWRDESERKYIPRARFTLPTTLSMWGPKFNFKSRITPISRISEKRSNAISLM